MIELLSPVGDFECLKAAVQNGADAVYFGSNLFSARAFASNFDSEMLQKAITYAKLRGVKTNLTLNTLIKNNEIADAINIAKKAYEYGIDAIIVQDLGLARYLIQHFPGLDVHGSTQMSIHNLDGALALQNMGFSRVVLSRELNLQEIDHICKNSNIEVEVFVHGALCISYSGQCLFSSIVGGRSGNRGRCAQPCRLPYELLENDVLIDKGFILSPRDLCGLDFLPQLVKSGVSCLKIEGRMKSPEYVATVTRIYRKYLDLAINSLSENSNITYKIDEQDKKDLLQVFNRGGFSDGHLNINKHLIYKHKPNNMGLPLGNVVKFNNNHGYISFKTNEILNIGDKISIENKNGETNIYTISELMINKTNIKQALPGDIVTVGRMKGNIFVGNKIYKISDKFLTSSALDTLNKETRKKDLNCKLIVKKDNPISFELFDNDGINIKINTEIIPEKAIKSPITKERIITQISKTNNTPFNFKNIEIDLDDGLYIPSISILNELRRNALSQYEEKFIHSFRRTLSNFPELVYYSDNKNLPISKNKQVSLLINNLNTTFDYTKLQNIDRLYIPLKYFILKDFKDVLQTITNNFNVFIYMPTIVRNNYSNLISNNLSKILNNYTIRGFVLSNLSHLELLKDYKNDYEFICNYTFNIYNNLTVQELNVNTITLSPELNKLDLENISYHVETTNSVKTELIVYGRTPLMNSNYCLLGKTNKCYSSCDKKCTSSNKYYLKDRLGFLFRIIPDNFETVTTIYNSKITSITHSDIPVDFIRIDVLDESVDEINNIINSVKSGNKLEGHDFTNGNFNNMS